MSPLETLANQLDSYPSVVSTDLDAVQAFIAAIADICAMTHNDVVVSRAAIQLHNAVGYPVGHIVFDSQIDMYRFVPHIDTPNKREES